MKSSLKASEKSLALQQWKKHARCSPLIKSLNHVNDMKNMLEKWDSAYKSLETVYDKDLATKELSIVKSNYKLMSSIASKLPSNKSGIYRQNALHEAYTTSQQSQRTTLVSKKTFLYRYLGSVFCSGCDDLLTRLLSRTKENPDRVFYKCLKCNIFNWAENITPSSSDLRKQLSTTKHDRPYANDQECYALDTSYVPNSSSSTFSVKQN